MNWNEIRAHYRRHMAAINAEQANEWAIDPYQWDGLFRLTPIEYWLWCDIRAVDAVLYPQFPAKRFFVDFANPRAKVAIECDGAAFNLDKEKDARRDAELAADGWTVYRITGKDCRTFYDEHARTQGAAYEFIKRIALRHGIRRGYA